jgi:hypothetical protein
MHEHPVDEQQEKHLVAWWWQSTAASAYKVRRVIWPWSPMLWLAVAADNRSTCPAAWLFVQAAYEVEPASYAMALRTFKTEQLTGEQAMAKLRGGINSRIQVGLTCRSTTGSPLCGLQGMLQPLQPWVWWQLLPHTADGRRLE